MNVFMLRNATLSVAASIVDSAMFYTLMIKFKLLMLAIILCDYLAELVQTPDFVWHRVS